MSLICITYIHGSRQQVMYKSINQRKIFQKGEWKTLLLKSKLNIIIFTIVLPEYIAMKN